MEFTCEICNKVYPGQKNLNGHLRKVHKQTERKVRSYEYHSYNQKCLECHTSFKNISDLRYHLQTFHKVEMVEERHEFITRGEFINWFNDLCASEDIQYTHKIYEDHNTEYFNCNRSGKVELKENRQRAAKSQGSCKLNYSCTSQIIMKKVDAKFNVIYYKTHYGHSKDVRHLRISQKDRTAIAEQLANGVSMKRLLDDNRNNTQGNSIKRIHLLTRRDLRNVKSQYNLKTNERMRHENDCRSVDLWVAKQKNSPNNCVLFYKKQGEEMVRLKTGDFCIIIMNASQRSVLQNYGSNIITMDSTQGLNPYGFHLTTLIVLDGHNEGFPAACMFSNRQDTFIFEIFFSMIKKEVGVISCRTFMSDTTDTFYNAWVKIMDVPTHRLFCSWNVDRDWQVHINKIKNVEKRKWIYKTVKVLQTTLDKDEFTKLIESYTKIFLADKDTSEFGHYFKKHYYNNVKAWADCFIKYYEINTNVHVESMHKMVKYLYLEAKKVQGLDKGFHAVLNFIRDKLVERVIKNTKGKNTRSNQIIAKHHRLSLTVKYNTNVIDGNDNIYKVYLYDDTNHYIVKRILENPCCKTMCLYCNICIHCYTCECTDYNIQHTICKHIHYIDLKYSEDPSEISTDLNSLKDKIHLAVEKIKELTNTLVEKNDYSSLNQMYLKLQEAQSIAASFETNTNSELTLDGNKKENRVKQEPRFKKTSKQVTFKSTKKRTKNVNRILSKPSKEDIECIKSIIPLF